MCRSAQEEAAHDRPLLGVSVRAATAGSYVMWTASPSFWIVFFDVAPGSFRNSA
jgi:hypothetical protein